MPTLKLPDEDNVAAAPSPGGGAGAAAPPSPHSTHPLSREEAQTSHFQASGGRRTTDAAADGAPDGAPDFDGGAASDGTTLLQTVDDGAGGAPAPDEHAAPTTDNALADAMRGAADSTRADAARVRDLSPMDEHDGAPGATGAAPAASLSKAPPRTPTHANPSGGPVGLMGREPAAAGPMGRGVWTTLPAWKTRVMAAGEPAGTRGASSVGTGARGEASAIARGRGGGPLFDARVGVPGSQVHPPGEAAVARAMMGHERAAEA